MVISENFFILHLLLLTDIDVAVKLIVFNRKWRISTTIYLISFLYEQYLIFFHLQTLVHFSLIYFL